MLGGTVWTSISALSDKIIGIVTIAFLARLLEPKDFGTVAVCMILIGIVSTFSDIGFQSAIIQRKGSINRAASTALCITVILSIVNFGILFMAAKPLSILYGDEAIVNIARVLSINLVIGSFTRVHNFLLSRELQFGRKAACETVPSAVYGLVAIPSAFAGYGVWSIVFGELAKSTTRSILLLVVSRWKATLQFDMKIAKELVSYGKHVMFNNLLNFGSINIDNAVVGKYLGLTSLSFYKIAYNAAALPGEILYLILGRVLVPAFAKVQDDLEVVTRQYLKVVEYSSYIFLPVFFGLFMLAPEFINLLYGPKWNPAVPLFRALLLFGLANVLMMFSNCLLLSTGRPAILPKITLARIILVILLLLTLMRISLLALCIGISTVQMALLFVQLGYIRRKYHVPIKAVFASIQTPAFFSLIMGASLYGAIKMMDGVVLPTALGLAVKVSIGSFVYMSLFTIFKRDTIQQFLLLRHETGR
ncbi:lipopolysaccharide biosynthesis protein [Candidatus Moduliflexota bacterium]